MKTALLIVIAALSLFGCSRQRAEPRPQIARIMPNGRDMVEADQKCSELSRDVDVRMACVRALRADVCGDGVSHTADGTLVQVVVGAHDTPEAEAMWSASQAMCVGMRTRPRLQAAAKACGVPVTRTCGSGRALIATRMP